MSTQSATLEALAPAFQKQISEMLEMNEHATGENDNDRDSGRSSSESSSADTRERLAEVTVEVLTMEPDLRLDYLSSLNPALTEEHLDQIAMKTEEWLDTGARERIGTKAGECYEKKADPRWIVIEWNTEIEVQRLVGLLFEAPIPDRELAVCYAMARATEICMATFTIHAGRQERTAETKVITQTPEEIAADLRFANAG